MIAGEREKSLAMEWDKAAPSRGGGEGRREKGIPKYWCLELRESMKGKWHQDVELI